jgi:predicted GIY-YIG superfamily endonuclease
MYQEEYATRSEAVRRERQIKSWKDRALTERLWSASRQTGKVVGSNPISSTKNFHSQISPLNFIA